MYKYITAETAEEAMAKMPKVGKLLPGTQLFLARMEAVPVRRSLVDWLIGKPKLWKVRFDVGKVPTLKPNIVRVDK